MPPADNAHRAKSRPPSDNRRLRTYALVAAALLGLLPAAELLYRAYWGGRARLAPDDGCFSLYVVGESTAAGEPYAPVITPAFLVGRMLGGQIGGRDIRVFSVARSGQSVYPQYAAFERLLRRRRRGPGAVLIYSAHNDAGTVGDLPLPELLKEKTFRHSLLLSDLFFYAEKKRPALRVRTRDTYAHYLEEIVKLSLRRGLTPVLATAVSNISDIDPGLFPYGEISAEEIRAALKRGLALETGRRWKQAVDEYARLARAYPGLARYLKYREAVCLDSSGRYGEALNSYRAALEIPGEDNFNRATAGQNAVIRGLAARYRVPLADAEEIFSAHSPHGIMGGELFLDGQHPSIRGYLLLARAYASAISGTLDTPLVRDYSGPEEALRGFGCGPACQASALLTSGRWLFSVSAQHARPVERLRLARERLQGALALEPDNFSALLRLALVEAAQRSDLLSEREGIAWLARHNLYYGSEHTLTDEQLPGVIKRLVTAGVSPALIKKISAAAPGRRARPTPGR